MALTIGYDISILETEYYTGVEKLAFCLFTEFWKSYPDIRNIVFCRKIPSRLSGELSQNTIVCEVPGGRFWRYHELPHAMKKHHIDCFVSPVAALPLQWRVPMLAYIHECPWRHYKENAMILHRLALWHAALKARALLCNSGATCDDLKKELGPFCPKLKIVPPAGDSRLDEIAPVSDEELFKLTGKKLDRPFALFVSTVRAKKNIGVIIDTFRKDAMKKVDIIIAGRIQDMHFVDAARGCDNIIFTGYVDDRILKTLYAKAGVFIYISASEGFGLPILEAFRCGLPVIASKKASIPEVAGKGALLLDEISPELLAESVMEILERPDFADTFKAGMKEQLEKYSWKESAGKLRKAIEDVV